MAVLDVVMYPGDPLTLIAEAYDTIGPEVAQLAQDMFETMYAYEGVGLAGPQVGVSKRIFVVRELEGEDLCLVNPEIVENDERELGEEGCLSIPQVYAMVERATHVRVKAKDQFDQTLNFEAEGFLARIIQHENDHINGILFPDRLDILTREAKLREWEEVRNQLNPST